MIRLMLLLSVLACNSEQRSERVRITTPATEEPAAATPTNEPRAGMPLELRVRIVTSTGEPARSVDARVYQTDAEGFYSKTADGSEAGGDHARLSYRVRTDADGRFTLRTIVPAPYPSGGPPAHIHLNIPPHDRANDLTIMLDSDPSLDRARVEKMARTWIGRVRVEGELAICDAEITAR